MDVISFILLVTIVVKDRTRTRTQTRSIIKLDHIRNNIPRPYSRLEIYNKTIIGVVEIEELFNLDSYIYTYKDFYHYLDSYEN